ncbi:STAS domain-containing protein [Anaeromyxobacter oryzae]|uniref:MlaB-like STAS domain-containing protein n=1 Tax=Anaeromyxobacter oryzae TaxID=2918170 RepID=A0ABN6N107_9BACT|nr:STAS domain-containing protein [Anaeromyxobacter oryzae]BDG06250.1 hypothetical protein AMOR_52460 [Anaeromyxobacter oryzae]
MGIEIAGPAFDHGVGRLVIELGPTFRAEDARRLHELIESSEPGTEVEIDFHAVRDCHAAALGQLARDLVHAGCRIALHGVRWHEKRLLGYLGVPMDAREGHA